MTADIYVLTKSVETRLTGNLFPLSVSNARVFKTQLHINLTIGKLTVRRMARVNEYNGKGSPSSVIIETENRTTRAREGWLLNMEAEGLKKIKIRTLTIKDYKAIVELWKRAGLPFKPRGRESRDMIKRQMRAFPEFFIGAFHKDELVGVVIGSYDGRMKGWINRLAIDPAYQKRGIAQQLISHVEEALEKRGASIFGALIETPNKESVRLFQRMGYVVHREILYVTKRKSQEV